MKKRDFGPDLVRAAAVSFVLAVHSFLYNGFYSVPLEGAGMFAASTVRMALMTCVPMFLMLTGYLCCRKELSWGYYRGLLPTLLTYLLACAACLAFRVFYGGESISILSAGRQVFDFSAAPYSWYIEMYMGLFLLCPFLNAMWKGLSDKGKKALMLTLTLLSGVPTVTNLWVQLFPDWWLDLYPLTYYFLGAWLREHPVTVKKRWLLLGWLGFSAHTAGLQFVIFRGGVFDWSPSNNRGSLLVMAETVCVFCLLISVKGDKCPKPVKVWVKWAAKLSLAIYLLSYITDQLLYGPLNGAMESVPRKTLFLPVFAFVNVCVTGVMASLVHWVVEKVMKLVPKGKKGENVLAPENK